MVFWKQFVKASAVGDISIHSNASSHENNKMETFKNESSRLINYKKPLVGTHEFLRSKWTERRLIRSQGFDSEVLNS